MSVGDVPQGALAQQAQHIWQMLDDLSQNDPAAYRSFIDQQMAERSKFMELPSPHMCVKTSVKVSGSQQRAAHINVFSWQQVPEPKSEESPIPIIGGPLQSDVESSGGSQVAAVAFNPAVLDQFGRDAAHPEECRMLVGLALDYLRDQHQIPLVRDYSILPPGQLYFGGLKQLQQSLIQRRYGNKGTCPDRGPDSTAELDSVLGQLGLPTDSPLIAQLGNLVTSSSPRAPGGTTSDSPNIHITKPSNNSQEVSNGCSPNIQVTKPCNNSSRRLIEELDMPSPRELITPQYELTGSSSNESALRLKVALPGITSVSQCELNISTGDIELQADDSYKLHVKLPCQVTEQEATAKFSRRSSTLSITLPKS